MSLHPEDRFWKNVDKRGPDECWPWKSTKLPGKWPYGIWSVGGKRVSAHRVAYAIQDGFEAGLTAMLEALKQFTNIPPNVLLKQEFPVWTALILVVQGIDPNEEREPEEKKGGKAKAAKK